MPRKDGTGPMGHGPMTGRSLGNCQNRVSGSENENKKNNGQNLDKKSDNNQK